MAIRTDLIVLSMHTGLVFTATATYFGIAKTAKECAVAYMLGSGVVGIVAFLSV